MFIDHKDQCLKLTILIKIAYCFKSKRQNVSIKNWRTKILNFLKAKDGTSQIKNRMIKIVDLEK